MLGCVAKPPEKPIVLRPPPPERRLVHRPPRQPPAQTAAKSGTPPASAAVPVPLPENEELSPAEKETLFQEFDDYLARSGHPQ